MTKEAGQWTMEDLVDFESEIAANTHTPPEVREAALAAIHGLGGASARRVGFRIWLEGIRTSTCGGKFESALSVVGKLLVLVLFSAGISGVWCMVNREIHGIHVTWFLAILIGFQWLVLCMAALAWAMRGRSAEGFSVVQTLAASLARRLAGKHDAPWWGRLMREGGAARAAVLWKIAGMAQVAGVYFNIGILCGLLGLLFTKDLRFYWETTTESAMAATLQQITHFLSLPWAFWRHGAVPDAEIIRLSRWQPGQMLPVIGSVWWEFCIMTTLFWGMLPRLILWWVSWNAGRRALASLDFQARSHRVLWREIAGPGRVESHDAPLDGVLVLDVGGSGLTAEALKTFFLRRLRVHPTAWHPVAVMDSGAETEVSRALANAPAGVVLLAEGWALSPARMSALHARIRTQTGTATPVKFVVANAAADHTPVSPNSEERREWERFVDSLRDPEAEVFFYETIPVGA